MEVDENFRQYRTINKAIRNALVPARNSDTNIPSYLEHRLRLLEYTAYYSPLIDATAPNTNDMITKRVLPCECNRFTDFHHDIQVAVTNAKSLLLMEIQNSIEQDSNLVLDEYLNNVGTCCELLRVQYNLNAFYERELRKLYAVCQQAGVQFEHFE